MIAGKTRIKDIAHLAGVSIGTVDRVLHNRGEVSEKTKLRIRNILEETGYSPNIAARALKSTKSLKLVSLLPEASGTNSYWIRHSKGMSKAITELEPFSLDLIMLNFDMQSEKDYQEKTSIVLEKNPDGVLIAPIFKAESLGFCRKLSQKKIPFVFIDSYIEDTGFMSYIGEDVYQSGKVAGHLIDMITEKNRDILVVSIARNLANVHHLKTRTLGFLNYLENSGQNKGRKISISISEPTSENIKKSMDVALENNPGVGSVFVSGSRSYLIAEYLKGMNLRDIKIIGYDLTDMNVSFLKEGFIRFLIGQRPEEQAFVGIKKLYEHLSFNKKQDKFEYLPMDIITAENVDYFL